SSNTESYFQEVKLTKVSPINRLLLADDGKEVKKKVVLKPNKMQFTGEAIYMGYGLESDYKGKNVSEKIVIVRSGAPNVTDTRAAYGLVEQKEQLAKKNGAVAVIEMIDADEITWGYIDHNFNS